VLGFCDEAQAFAFKLSKIVAVFAIKVILSRKSRRIISKIIASYLGA
jgi:hypothetical protein